MPETGQPFEVLLLGPPQIRWEGQLFNLAGRQNRLLVYYLAATRQVVERRSLENLIWPSEEQTDIGRQLRQAIFRLRRALPDRSLLIETKANIGLDWSRVYCDAGHFETLLADCLRKAEDEQRSIPLANFAVVETMRQAIGLWHGNKILQSVDLSGSPALENWFIQQEHTLESGRRWLLERLSDHESASHRPLEALKFVQAALDGHEMDENLHERILNLLLRTGQRSQARRHYKRMLKIFSNAGLQPNQALAVIGAQLESPGQKDWSAGSSRQPRRRFPPAQVDSPDLDVPWQIYHPGDEPFVGRMIILDSLRQIAQRGGGALIYGESGQGKTRLLKEFYAHLAPPPRLILAASQPGENDMPFQPLITALSRQVTPAEWLQLPAPWAGYLSLLFPDLRTRRTGLRTPNVENPDLIRTHIFRALSELFTILADRRPDGRLVLILDDAHWADEATLKALFYLHHHPPFSQNGLMILAARIEELNPGLETLASDLGKNQRFDQLKLHNLSEAGVAQLVKHYLGETPPAQLVRQLVKATGGNPLYVIEIMRDWWQNQRMAAEPALKWDHSAIPLPGTLLELMQYRLNRLSPDAQRLLNLLAILGDEFDARLVNRLANQQEWQNLHQTMDQLIQFGLVLPGQGSAGNITQFFFTHDKFREAALLSMPANQKGRLHLQAAVILEQEAGHQANDQAALIAQHYEAGGNFPAAFHYWVLATQQSLRLSAWDTTLLQLKHSDSLLDSCMEDTSNDDLYQFFRTWSHCLNTANDAPGLDKLSLRLQELGTRCNRPLLLGLSQHLKAVAAFTRNEIETGLELIQGYQGYMEKSGHPLALAETLTQKGVLHYMRGQITASLEALYKSREILEPLTATSPSASEQARFNQYEISIAETLGGRPITGYEHAIAALNALEKMGNPTTASFCHGTAALASYYMGNLRQGLQHCQEGLSLAFENSAMRGIGYLSLFNAMILAAMGDLDASLANAEIAEEFGRRYERREIYSFADRIRGDIFYYLEGFEQAAQFHQNAYAENPDLFAAIDYQIRAANSQLLLLDDVNTGTGQNLHHHVAQLEKQAQQMGLDLGIRFAAHFEMSYLYKKKDWDALQALSIREQGALTSSGMMIMWYYANYFLAQIELARGQTGAAQQRLMDTAAWAKDMGFLWLELMVLRNLVKINLQHHLTLPMGLTERVTSLLKHIQDRGQHPLVRDPVERFCEKIEQEIASTHKLTR